MPGFPTACSRDVRRAAGAEKLRSVAGPERSGGAGAKREPETELVYAA